MTPGHGDGGHLLLSEVPDAIGVRERLPDVARALALIGEPITDDFLRQFERRYGSSHLSSLLNREISGWAFWDLWTTAGNRSYRELFELLVLEDTLCNHPAQISKGFHPSRKLDKTIHIIRQHIALALYDRARELASSQPLTSVRVLKLAERYLEEICTHEYLSRDTSRSGFLGRLGVAVVLQGRHTELDEDALIRALDRLRESMTRGNDAPEAGAYLAEGLLRLADLKRDKEPLIDIIKRHGIEEGGTPGHTLTIAEAWLHMSEYAEGRSGKYAFLHRAISTAESVTPENPSTLVRQSLICAIATECDRSNLSPRGLRLPFGLRKHMRIWSIRAPAEAARSLDSLIDDLDNGPYCLPKFGLGRRTLASLLSVRAGIAQTDPALAASLLTRAIGMRYSASKARGEAEAQLEDALDTLALFRLQERNRLLADACVSLIDLAESDPTWATPVLLLANIAEEHAKGLTQSVRYAISQGAGERRGETLIPALEANSAALYEMAARRALASSEVDRRHIGGRSGVFRAADYTGLLEDVFVFKPTLVALADREDARSSHLRSVLAQEGLLRKFGVATTLARTTVATDDILYDGRSEVVAARRFHSGQLLSRMKGRSADEILPILRKTAEFLALIHTSEVDNNVAPTRVRNQLLRKEFGYWLRDGLRVADVGAIFSPWWDLLSTVPVVPRRDAHPLNWIMGDDGSIIAVDLEACGWRPVGYELAQLTDDVGLLGVDDVGLNLRTSLLETYRSVLEARGMIVQQPMLQVAYEASLVARAVRHLTNQEMDKAERAHGKNLLEWLRLNSRHERIRWLAEQLEGAWNIRRGGGSERDLTDGRRRHLSRALAYQLRHGEDSMRDENGWAHFAAVSDALRHDGIATNKDELRLVANAIDEARFETDGPRVRALYGHSRPVDIVYEQANFDGALFHGTASENINAILQAGQGLVQMKRNWVHLSREPMLAARTAQRHGAYTILSVSVDNADDVLHAAGSVYLMKSIPAEQLRVVTPTQLLFLRPGGR